MDMCLLSVGASTPKLLLIVHGPNKPLKRVSKKSVVIRWAVNKKWVSYIDIFLGLITPLSWEQLRRPSAKIWMWNLTGMGCVPNPIFLPLLGIKYLECMSVFRQGFVQILHGAICTIKNSPKIRRWTLHTLNKRGFGDITRGSNGSADGEGLSGSPTDSLVLQKSYKAELGQTKVLLRGNLVSGFDDEIFTLIHDLDETMTS